MTSTITTQQTESIPQADLAQFLACETPNLTPVLTADAPINGKRIA